MTKKITIYKKKLAQDIKRICQKKNISIPSLETAVGYSPGMISRWASSSATEDFNVLSKLVTMASILDVSVDSLLGIHKNTASLDQPENPDVFSTLTAATVNGNLVWNVLDTQNTQLPFGSQFLDSENDRMIAEIWYTEQTKVYFLLVSYCDDLADFNEPLELVLYAFVGHGIAPLPIRTTDPRYLHTLYAYIQFMAASESLLHAKIDLNNPDITHVTDAKHNLSQDKMIAFENIKEG